MFDRSVRGMRQLVDLPVTNLVLTPIISRQPPAIPTPITENHNVEQTITLPDVEIDIASTPLNVDWQAEASEVAKRAAKQISSPSQYRDFNLHDPCSESDPLNSLKKECQRKTNNIDWKSESPAAGFGFGKHPHSNGHLFDEFKPEYLKKPVEDICTKNMVGCNHSSSSSSAP